MDPSTQALKDAEDVLTGLADDYEMDNSIDDSDPADDKDTPGSSSDADQPRDFNPDDYDDGSDDDDIEADAGNADETGSDEDDDDLETDDDDSNETSDQGDDESEDDDTDDVEDGIDEDQQTGEEGTEKSPIQLESDDIKQFVVADGLEKPTTIAELVEGFNNQMPRDKFLQKTQELADKNRQADDAIAQATQLLADKTAQADNYEAPHVFLAGYLQEMVQLGVMPQELYADIDAVFKDHISEGSYQAQAVGQRLQAQIQTRQDAAKSAQAETQKWKENTIADVALIESTDKIKLSQDQKNKIAKYIQDYAQENDVVLRVKDAYPIMKATGLLKSRPKTAKSPSKVGKRLRRTGKGSTAPKPSKKGSGEKITAQEDAIETMKAMGVPFA